MRKPRWLKPSPEYNLSGLTILNQNLLLYLAVAIFYGAWLTLAWVPDNRMANGREALVMAVGSAVAMATLLLRRRAPIVAGWVLAVGSLPFIALIFVIYGRAETLCLFALAPLAATLLLGSRPGLLLTALVMGSLLALGRWAGGAISGYAMVWVLTIAGLGLVTRQVLDLLDFWERETTSVQREMIGELRDRQGQLNRTLKALDESYASLKRSNDELAVLRRAAEEARVLKEQFVANVSHELRTPLNLIVGFAEVMYLAPESYDGVTWTPDLESDIRHMYRASRHLQSLIDDILDLSRIDAARLPMFRELCDVREIVRDALETAAPLLQQHHLAQHLEAPAELPELFVDRTRIRQVILNLLNNAVRYTDSGSIRLRITLLDQIVQVSVQDTGIGIPADQLEHIFEEFRQATPGPRSRGGAGLGLAISRKFMEMHGGRLRVESTVGHGSTFYLTLPLPGATPQAQALYRTPERRRPDPSGAPVLLVEPDATIAAMLSRYLGDRPLLTAGDARQTEALVRQEHPRVVIVNQPPDLPPEAWLGALGPATEQYGVPIVRCSIPSPSWLRRSADVLDCLTKPISRQVLRAALERLRPLPQHILVVDDDPGFLSLMQRLCATIVPGIKVTTASTGAFALRLLREAQPDLVLLDLLMPEMDGSRLLQIIREDPNLASTGVIIVTGTSYAEEPLRHLGTTFSINQSLGLRTNVLIELLEAVLPILKPAYEPSPVTEATA